MFWQINYLSLCDIMVSNRHKFLQKKIYHKKLKNHPSISSRLSGFSPLHPRPAAIKLPILFWHNRCIFGGRGRISGAAGLSRLQSLLSGSGSLPSSTLSHPTRYQPSFYNSRVLSVFSLRLSLHLLTCQCNFIDAILVFPRRRHSFSIVHLHFERATRWNATRRLYLSPDGFSIYCQPVAH